jgi:capsular polysaccharide biosynthesis protein
VLLNLAVALILGTVLGAATALIRERRDRRLRSDDDVELLLGQPLLGRLACAAHTLPDARVKRLAFWRTPALGGA